MMDIAFGLLLIPCANALMKHRDFGWSGVVAILAIALIELGIKKIRINAVR